VCNSWQLKRNKEGSARDCWLWKKAKKKNAAQHGVRDRGKEARYCFVSGCKGGKKKQPIASRLPGEKEKKKKYHVHPDDRDCSGKFGQVHSRANRDNKGGEKKEVSVLLDLGNGGGGEENVRSHRAQARKMPA